MVGKAAALLLAMVVVLCSLAIVWSVAPAVELLAKYERDYERSKMYLDMKIAEIDTNPVGMTEELVYFGNE